MTSLGVTDTRTTNVCGALVSSPHGLMARRRRPSTTRVPARRGARSREAFPARLSRRSSNQCRASVDVPIHKRIVSGPTAYQSTGGCPASRAIFRTNIEYHYAFVSELRAGGSTATKSLSTPEVDGRGREQTMDQQHFTAQRGCWGSRTSVPSKMVTSAQISTTAIHDDPLN